MKEFDLQHLYQLQLNLDSRILKQHGLDNKDLINEKLLALIVEVAELANETKCFKYWSVRKCESFSKVIEEYVDGLHFILSLGLELRQNQEIDFDTIRNSEITPTLQFLKVNQAIIKLFNEFTAINHLEVLNEYLKLGMLLEISSDQIYSAYVRKNEVNHTRQDTRY